MGSHTNMLQNPAAPLILVIDDQAALGQLIRRVVHRVFPNAQVLMVTSGSAELDLAERYADSLSMVILDVHTSVVDGRLAPARGISSITDMNNSALYEDVVVLPRATVTKLHAQLDEHYQRVSRSRELRQAIRTLREALEESGALV